MSPHQYGWPLYRPRLYTVLVNMDSMEMHGDQRGFQKTLQLLHRKCMIDVSRIYLAPKDFALVDAVFCSSSNFGVVVLTVMTERSTDGPQLSFVYIAARRMLRKNGRGLR